MRIIKLELKRSVPFWRLGKVQLNSNNTISEPIDADSLTETQAEIIENAVSRNEINILNREGKRINSLYETEELNEFLVDERDIEEDEELLPQVQSVTVQLDEEEEEDIIAPSKDEIMDKALVIVNNNGNSVKKAVSVLKDKTLLSACLSAEIADKNRSGVIDAIKKSLENC